MVLKKMILSAFAIGALLFVPAMSVGMVFAADDTTVQNALCKGANELTIDASGGGSCEGTSTGTEKVNATIVQVINIFSTLVGVIAVIMIIWGGLRYITSGGDSGKITSAKNTIIYALIGLVVVALAQFIVKFVLNKVTTNN